MGLLNGGFHMFNIGDKVVYPMHGAGIIESIEEKEILGNKQKYYIMRMPIGNMKVMIPLEFRHLVQIKVVGNNLAL
jgi:CarD family transcriptional regulator